MPRADAAERAALPTPQGQARDLRIFAGKKTISVMLVLVGCNLRNFIERQDWHSGLILRDSVGLLYHYTFLSSVFSGPQPKGVGHTQSYASFLCLFAST